MNFAQWLSDQGLTDLEAARRLADTLGRPVDRATIYRIRRGQHRPSSVMIAAILELSQFRVDANSFFIGNLNGKGK